MKRTPQEIANFTGLKIVIWNVGVGVIEALYRLDEHTVTPVHMPIDLNGVGGGDEFIPQVESGYVCPACGKPELWNGTGTIDKE